MLPALCIEVKDSGKDSGLNLFVPHYKDSKGLMALAGFGFGEIIGSFVMGKIIDRYGGVKGSY